MTSLTRFYTFFGPTFVLLATGLVSAHPVDIEPPVEVPGAKIGVVCPNPPLETSMALGNGGFTCVGGLKVIPELFTDPRYVYLLPDASSMQTWALWLDNHGPIGPLSVPIDILCDPAECPWEAFITGTFVTEDGSTTTTLYFRGDALMVEIAVA